MEEITNIESIGNITTAIFATTDVSKVNLLKRAILSEIDTYCIDIVIFHINTSSRHDEIIALRLGQLVIDHDKFIPPEGGDFRARIDVKGPHEFTSKDIPELPVTLETPIIPLREGQRIMCDVIVKQGNGKIHVKWRPVSKVWFNEIEDGYKISIKTIGMMSGKQIFEEGQARMRAAASEPPLTLYSRVLVPSEFQ